MRAGVQTGDRIIKVRKRLGIHGRIKKQYMLATFLKQVL